MKRWHHGHSLAAGALVGLGAASYRVWLLLAVAFLAGCGLTLAVVNGRRLLHWTRDMLEVWKLHKRDRQRSRLTMLRDRGAERRGFPRGY